MTAPAAPRPAPAVEQIWREGDPRKQRFVTVTLTDAEILTPGLLTFPNGGSISVHSHDCASLGDTAQVYYALRMSEAAEWTLLRSPIAVFLVAVRTAGGTRAPELTAERIAAGEPQEEHDG